VRCSREMFAKVNPPVGWMRPCNESLRTDLFLFQSMRGEAPVRHSIRGRRAGAWGTRQQHYTRGVLFLLTVMAMITALGCKSKSNRLVAEAGPDQTVVVGQTVHLEGHGSSAAGGEPLRFQWTGLTGPAGSHTALTDAATATPSFVADQAGTYVVQLVVVAGGQASAPSIVRITAVPPPATVRNLFHTGTTPVTTYTLISPLTPQDTLPPRLPGVGLSEEPAVGANLLGSVLVFPKFDIRSGASTQLRITDTSQGPRGGTSAFARLNFVCPGTKADPFCDVLDIDISFTYHRTVVIDVATELPPCDRGFIIVFAEGANGNPVSYNHLTGSYHITSGTGPSARAEAANAIAIQSLQPAGTVLGAANANTGGLDLTFSTTSGADYAALPAALHSDFRAVTATSRTILTLLTLNIISGADNPTARVNVHFWNTQEVPFSASHEFVCWDQVSLDQIDRHFTAVGLGTGNGALRITPSSNCPASRSCPPLFFYNAAVLGILYETGSPVE
jgi:hypothetical protein